jgi:hypothetical protein
MSEPFLHATGPDDGAGTESGTRQPSGPGATAGLPGENADPRTASVTEDQLSDTVMQGDEPETDRSTGTGANG